VALGKPIDLRNIETPLFLLAAGRDELVTPPQLFAVERLVGTSPDELCKLTADCRHLGLFMGKRVCARCGAASSSGSSSPARSLGTNRQVKYSQRR